LVGTQSSSTPITCPVHCNLPYLRSFSHVI
jgi:hypothetical protein